ncbi:iron-sulfur cluster assembly scaffold protein [Blastopirellula marina]|uniref:Nitrogen fixation protein NifU n=1 Tax=Blastopirellula marina TaxID=124 RepID=A0A2S8GIF7_9BACT|nr:iron-sulfur cluster assembly scaffold protein [Blastopirellula marina]PQO43814.1 nitrogen fixation protein NifU [Blastopirellula marina]
MYNSEWLIDYARSPYHRGELQEATNRAKKSSPTCADCVTLQIEITVHRIKQAWHVSEGCIVCQASASYLCEWCEGKSLNELRQIQDSDYLNLLGPLTPLRQNCALLAFHCLQTILRDIEGKA